MGTSMVVILCIAAFFVGGAVGGVSIYAANAKAWHARDMDELLGRLELIESNTSKMHRNMKTVVSMSQRYEKECLMTLESVEEHVAAIDRNVAENTDGLGGTLRSVYGGMSILSKQEAEIRDLAERAAESSESAVERLKLM